MDRRCPTCNTFKALALFRSTSWGAPARDCKACEAIKKQRGKPAIAAALPALKPEPKGWDGTVGVAVPKEFRGVDIDAIHYKLGAVRPKKAA